MIVFLAVAALLVAAIALFMNRPEFGRAPRGERLERIWRSPNYRDGAFRNRHATPQLTSGKGCGLQDTKFYNKLIYYIL